MQDLKAVPSAFANLSKVELLTFLQGNCLLLMESARILKKEILWGHPKKKPTSAPSCLRLKGQKSNAKMIDKKWHSLPPDAGTPTTKVISGCTYHWCDKFKQPLVHHPYHCCHASLSVQGDSREWTLQYSRPYLLTSLYSMIQIFLHKICIVWYSTTEIYAHYICKKNF